MLPNLSQQSEIVAGHPELEGKSYFNFINSLKSEFTKKNYRCALSRFLNHYNITTEALAKTSAKDIDNLSGSFSIS